MNCRKPEVWGQYWDSPLLCLSMNLALVFAAQRPSECGGKDSSQQPGICFLPRVSKPTGLCPELGQSIPANDSERPCCGHMPIPCSELFTRFGVECFWLGTIKYPFKSGLNNEDDVMFLLTKIPGRLLLVKIVTQWRQGGLLCYSPDLPFKGKIAAAFPKIISSHNKVQGRKKHVSDLHPFRVRKASQEMSS